MEGSGAWGMQGGENGAHLSAPFPVQVRSHLRALGDTGLQAEERCGIGLLGSSGCLFEALRLIKVDTVPILARLPGAEGPGAGIAFFAVQRARVPVCPPDGASGALLKARPFSERLFEAGSIVFWFSSLISQT